MVSDWMVVNNRLTIQWLYVDGPYLPQNNQVSVQCVAPLKDKGMIGCTCGCNLASIDMGVGFPAQGPNFRFICKTTTVQAGTYWGFAIIISV